MPRLADHPVKKIRVKVWTKDGIRTREIPIPDSEESLTPEGSRELRRDLVYIEQIALKEAQTLGEWDFEIAEYDE